ncbi:MAG: hypothetical protein L7U53_03025, partial [Candidatus Poseidoniaceae archaeon]|nr:hypothetical protein [Candidatus Poseidoniaceae archaeon]
AVVETVDEAATEVAVAVTEEEAETEVAVAETEEEAVTVDEAAETEAVVDSDNVAKVAVAVLADIEDFTN